MYIYDATEEAYKNGYDKGYEDGKRERQSYKTELNNLIKNLQKLFDRAWLLNMCGESNDISKMVTTYIPDVIQELSALYEVNKDVNNNV